MTVKKSVTALEWNDNLKDDLTALHPASIEKLTSGLRWNDDVLEQAWQDVYTGEIRWKPVPKIERENR